MPSFTDLISNPLKGKPAEKIFGELSTTLVFFINLTYIVLYGALVIMVVYNILKLAQKMIFVDYEESYERFKAGILNILFIILGIVMLVGIRDILAFVLKTLGAIPSENIFINLPF